MKKLKQDAADFQKFDKYSGTLESVTWVSFQTFQNNFFILPLFLGAHGNCHREGTKLKCTGTFKGRPFAVKTDVKVCHNPVETDIEFKILDKTFIKHYTGDQDFLLQGISFDQYKGVVYLLNVNVKPLSNGDRKITVSCQLTFTCYRITRKWWEVFSKLTIQTLEWGQWPDVFIGLIFF